MLVNDPLPQVTYHVTGKSELAGDLSVNGVWVRASNSLTVTLDAPGIPDETTSTRTRRFG